MFPQHMLPWEVVTINIKKPWKLLTWTHWRAEGLNICTTFALRVAKHSKHKHGVS